MVIKNQDRGYCITFLNTRRGNIRSKGPIAESLPLLHTDEQHHEEQAPGCTWLKKGVEEPAAALPGPLEHVQVLRGRRGGDRVSTRGTCHGQHAGSTMHRACAGDPFMLLNNTMAAGMWGLAQHQLSVSLLTHQKIALIAFTTGQQVLCSASHSKRTV